MKPNKKYMPIIYIDQHGEIYSREAIKQKLYKKIKETKQEVKQNGETYIYTSFYIRITEQDDLFKTIMDIEENKSKWNELRRYLTKN